jgi:alginate O-acetyltransferase complex protein AlgI
MMFNTPEFLVLLLASFALYYILPSGRVWILTVANVLFYSVVGYGYLLLFAVVSSITFAGSLYMRRTSGRTRKLLLGTMLAVNIGNLVFFKYTGFLLYSLEKFLHFPLIAGGSSEWMHIALPLGISFYTFELISYAVDVYKDKFEPERSLWRFWIFIMFFAHMIAGPIMRGNEFLPQIRKLKEIRFQMTNMRLGMLYIIVGLIKKYGFPTIWPLTWTASSRSRTT